MKNVCSIQFDASFKDIIQKEKANPLFLQLSVCTTLDRSLKPHTIALFERYQGVLRNYIKKTYPNLIHGKPDYFAVLVALVHPPCSKWSDIILDDMRRRFPICLVGLWTTCACGQRCKAENSFVLKHPDSDYSLLVGCCCIKKNEIVCSFDPKDREREIVFLKKKLANFKMFRARHFFTIYKTFLHQKELPWIEYQTRLYHLHKSRPFSSCQICRKNVKMPFKVCWGCRTTTYDTCKCGKSKQKKYPKCYTCNTFSWKIRTSSL